MKFIMLINDGPMGLGLGRRAIYLNGARGAGEQAHTSGDSGSTAKNPADEIKDLGRSEHCF